MNVCVQGLWHLGCVTAACLAAAGHEVIGLDSDISTVDGLRKGRAPIYEPGLDELIASGLAEKRLSFTTDSACAVAAAQVLWVTYDTPVDEKDLADSAYVVARIRDVMPMIADGALVIVSSQLPAGSCTGLEADYARLVTGKRVGFAYSPENLRLGNALTAFREPDRIVVGVRDERDRAIAARVLSAVTPSIEWMSVESAEMTKHALNGFLAISVTFANEVATLCEQIGADAKEVERGLKSERRIGPRAYLSPGAAFAGGTLARDVGFLVAMAQTHGVKTPLLASVHESNAHHQGWTARKLAETLGSLKDKRIALWGLTYKAGTNTLRRSSAVQLAVDLVGRGAQVRAFDPAIQELPADLSHVELAANAEDCANQADALVVMTEWPEFRQIKLASVLAAMRQRVLIDATRFLGQGAAEEKDLRYVCVGTPRPGRISG